MDLRWEILAGYGPLFVSGLLMTIQLTLVAIGTGLVLGAVFGLISTSNDAPRPATLAGRALLHAARALTLAYVTFFRSPHPVAGRPGDDTPCVRLFPLRP